jgi:hypothetical protein
MATLILTAVGTAVGGPIGGAIGALIGQQADRRLFAPKGRHGPRLGDLAVQTSSYGTQIPKIFGTMRVAGNVVWSTDLIETRATNGGGKGAPKVTSYTYSASFAVALSARPIRSVKRIWADGKLLRGAAGDFKSATGFRLHAGDEDQPVDPLIAAAEGLAHTTAFRGIAYAVFEDFQLEDYGNRIPSLTFEVEADAAPVPIGAIATILGEGEIEAGPTPALRGYAASGDSLRGAVEALTDIVPLSLKDEGGRLRIGAHDGATLHVDRREESGRREMIRLGSSAIPREVTIAYYDLDRDYQTGLQRANLEAADGLSVDRRALPAALTADMAKGLARHRLSMHWGSRSRASVTLGWRRCGVRPADRISLEGEGGVWRVERWSLGPMTVTLDLIREVAAPMPIALDAAHGRSIAEADLVHGPTIVRIHDLPIGVEGRPDAPLLAAFASGPEPGWRRASLMATFDGGENWTPAGRAAPASAIGQAVDVLSPGGSALFDLRSAVEVELLNETMRLESRSDHALVNGANLALLGSELIQFGIAEPVGPRRFRLRRLLRGRRGTEWASDIHMAGDPFALIDARALTVIDPPVGTVDGDVTVMAAGIGDVVPVTASTTISAEALRPPSPVHLVARALETGAIAVRWTRRSRQGWSWTNGADAPLAEERELYRVTITSAGSARDWFVGEPQLVYEAQQQAEDGATRPMTIAVRQIGTWAESRVAVHHLD